MSDDPDKFHVGDIVRVRNIVGPRMMITGFDQDPRKGLVCCKWFNRRFELETEWFHLRMLAKFTPSKDKPMGYRAALIEIRDKAFSPRDDDMIWMNDGSSLGLFIDTVLANGHGAPIDPLTHEEPEGEELAVS